MEEDENADEPITSQCDEDLEIVEEEFEGIHFRVCQQRQFYSDSNEICLRARCIEKWYLSTSATEDIQLHQN